MINNLRNKRVLITAGPTWVPIDIVRVISNVASGETGILLAERLSALGADVTLILGPVAACCLAQKVRVINFRFFDQLREMLKRELKSRRYDVIIHSAAVSDFKPKAFFKGKIDSDKTVLLELEPLPKIIKDIRHLAPRATLVMFKLEAGVSDNVLVRRASKAKERSGADIAVANRLDPYRAFIIDKAGNITAVKNKQELTKGLLSKL
ncbi:MAG: phosphopantothenoylcysteine decarboxylase [Candidatus Omnitrophica bacterium]|nr:phosphopantothenoylcysteine decarboxylase [Candidatus Omnitrophota bacterium]